MFYELFEKGLRTMMTINGSHASDVTCSVVVGACQPAAVNHRKSITVKCQVWLHVVRSSPPTSLNAWTLKLHCSSDPTTTPPLGPSTRRTRQQHVQ
jgi:hypothetical protein